MIIPILIKTKSKYKLILRNKRNKKHMVMLVVIQIVNQMMMIKKVKLRNNTRIVAHFLVYIQHKILKLNRRVS